MAEGYTLEMAARGARRGLRAVHLRAVAVRFPRRAGIGRRRQAALRAVVGGRISDRSHLSRRERSVRASQASPVDALHPPRGVHRQRSADHRPRRGLLRVGPTRQALPRRAVRVVHRAGRPRSCGTRSSRCPSGRDARLLPGLVVRPRAGDRVGDAPRRARARRSQPRVPDAVWRRGARHRDQAVAAVLQARSASRRAPR